MSTTSLRATVRRTSTGGPQFQPKKTGRVRSVIIHTLSRVFTNYFDRAPRALNDLAVGRGVGPYRANVLAQEFDSFGPAEVQDYCRSDIDGNDNSCAKPPPIQDQRRSCAKSASRNLTDFTSIELGERP